eukprot:TRINITY_DN86322_c0_g1_i1.p1 TRINITY_DN86322_c0_g1~~TRINITY_DN86322_c0_g1_i1.p1  ORF type:complete len:366 (+),score=37.85 TRINITY_DN86322_c0_g1_i1:63-1160(+)
MGCCCGKNAGAGISSPGSNQFSRLEDDAPAASGDHHFATAPDADLSDRDGATEMTAFRPTPAASEGRSPSGPGGASAVARVPDRPTMSVSLPAISHCCQPIQPLCKGLMLGLDYSFVWQIFSPAADQWADLGHAKTVPQSYTPQVDDVGCYLRIKMQPMGGGKPLYSDITTVGIESTMQITLTALLVVSSTSFVVSQTDATGVASDWQLQLDRLSFSLAKRKKQGGWSKMEEVKWGPHVDVVLNPVDTKSFTLHYFQSAQSFVIQSHPGRDVLALAFRLFQAMAIQEICEEVCSAEVASRWKRGTLTPQGDRELLEHALHSGTTDFPPVPSATRGYIKARNTLIALKMAAFASPRLAAYVMANEQ